MQGGSVVFLQERGSAPRPLFRDATRSDIAGMIAFLLLAAAATAPATPLASAHDLIAGAEHAIRVNRIDQATVMATRALSAGAAGRDMDRLLADLAFAKGQYADALARYSALLKNEPLKSDYL